MNDIAFAPAVRTDTAIILALAGASGSGKTKSALELAVGLAGAEGKVLVIDTEGRRALHYADDYRFFHCEWRPPFSPAALGELLRAAEARGFSVIIVDSMSDEHEGEGGLCDMAEAELAKQKPESRNSAAAWARPKAEHKAKIVRWLRQTRCHVIFCLRADEKVRFEKAERYGRQTTVVVPMGWTPIAEKRLLYDVTTSLLFTPDRPGYPEPIKLYDKHRRFFPPDRLVSREAGQLLREWAAGGVPETHLEPTLSDRARDAALKGKSSLSDFWKALNQPQRHEIKDLLFGELARIAKEADTAQEPLPDDPFGLTEQNPGNSSQDRPQTGAQQTDPAGGATTSAPARGVGIVEVIPEKLPAGGMDWVGYAESVLAEYRKVAASDRPDFRRRNAPHLALLRQANRDASTDLQIEMGRVDEGGRE